LVVLLLYAYCVGIPSSRRIERACWEDAAFRVLTGNQQPDHSRISDFRLVHLDALASLFVQVLRLCQKAGLVSLGNVALDGTKVKANASKHKAMSHERMLKTEAQLEAEIAALLRKAELIDAQEDARYGKGKRGDELPKELELRQDRLDALRKAKAELEAEAAADHARRREQQARAAEEQAAEAAAQAADTEAAAAADNDEADAESEAAAWALAKEAQQAERRAKAARGRAELARKLAIDKAQAAGLSTPDPLSSVDPVAMPSRNLPTTAAGEPKANAQRNHRCAEAFGYTDPDSHILKGGDGWIQGYNCQAAVDGDHQIIVAVGVSNQASDAPHLQPMVERIVANTGQLPEKLIADAGYCSTGNIETSEQRGLDTYLSTSRQEHGKRPRPSRGPAPRDLDARGRMDRKLRSKAGQAIYALRKTIVEPVFGQIKGARGLDRFLLRGLEKVDREWTLMAITHNIGKLHRAALAAS
jgi:hypothetical protein